MPSSPSPLPRPVPRLVPLLAWLAAPLLWLLLPATGVAAQMVDPAIDLPGRPFSYFSRPTDVIGVMNAPSATEVTPEGFLYTGFGELMFFTGPERTPLAARLRTLEEGRLPIVRYETASHGVRYGFTVFAAQIPRPQTDEAAPTGQIANFVRVELSNPANEPRTAFLSTAIRYEGPQTTAQPQADNRFRRPATAERIGDYQQPGEPFRADWSYAVGSGLCLRDNRVLFRYPQAPAPAEQLTFNTHYNRILPLASHSLELTPVTPVCAVQYTVPLRPHESRTLELVMPLLPPAAGSAEAANLAQAQFDTAHAGVVAFWHRLLSRGMQLELPEAKPVEAFYASLVYDLLGRNIVDRRSIQTAEQFQYHRFYLRDGADYVRMYDATGYPDLGGEALSFFLDRQTPDGNFLSQPGQYDGWGEAMWAFGEHYRMTHDLAFAARVYPAMVRAVDWLVRARAADPLHIMPATDVRDNEYIAGHLTGYNLLALDGLDAAILMADALHHPEDRARFQRERDSYAGTFFPLLAAASARQGGKLPPCLDPPGAWKGTDWGNLLSITPEPQLDPWDPRVTATLRGSQAHYQEGITTYAEPDDGIFLHDYLIMKNTLTELVRGEDQQAVRELYAELLHTSSTHGGFEYAIRPWGTRDFQGNLAPHAWFAADLRNVLRNMLVREEGTTLHLLSAVSPAWLGDGKRIAVQNATTYFGPVSFRLTTLPGNTLDLAVDAHFTNAPQTIALHLPWFLQVRSITVDGAPAGLPKRNVLALSPAAHRVRIAYTPRPTPPMSYELAVQSYTREYRRRWERLLADGTPAAATQDSWTPFGEK